MVGAGFNCPYCGFQVTAVFPVDAAVRCPRCRNSVSGRSRISPATPVECENEIYIRHMYVDEALLVLDRMLNNLFLKGVYQIRVIHGKGKGTLRDAVRSALLANPLVKGLRDAFPEEGAGGVTIVELWESDE